MRRVISGGTFFVIYCAAVVAQTPVISIEANAINGVPIPGGPVAAIEAAPGDVLELYFRLRDWSVTPTTRLKGYQMSVEHDSFHSGASGSILPIGLEVHTHPCGGCDPCPTDCPPCLGDGGQEALLVDTEHPDFPYMCGTDLATVDSNSCDYRWAAAVLQSNCAPLSTPGHRAYVATLFVLVSEDATGTFTIEANDDPNDGCLLRDQMENPILPIEYEPLTIVTPGGANGGPILFSVPPNNAIDARQDADLNCFGAPGPDFIVIVHEDNTLGINADSYAVTVEPPGGPVPTIMNVASHLNQALLTLDQPIPPGKWTRFTHIQSGTSTRIGFLPGDVSNDRTASPLDILSLIDHLNGIVDLFDYQTDIDRSGTANPPDILRLIDLLAGGPCESDSWNGRSLPP